MDKLVDLLGDRQVLQPHATQIAQGTGRGQVLAHPIDNGLRQEDLPAVGRAHDPRRAIDGIAEVVVVAPLDHAEMQPAAH